MSKYSHKKQNNIKRNTKSKVSIILAIIPTHQDNLNVLVHLDIVKITMVFKKIIVSETSQYTAKFFKGSPTKTKSVRYHIIHLHNGQKIQQTSLKINHSTHLTSKPP